MSTSKPPIKITPERQALVKKLVAENVKFNRTCPEDAEGGLVALRAGGERLPLFLVPAAGGTSLGFRALSRFFHPSQPLYSFDPKWTKDGMPAHTTLAEMAKSNLVELRRIQPQGPYALAGWCFGGTLAFEMAQQLVRQEECVRFLGFVDASSPDRSGDPLGVETPGGILGLTSRAFEQIRTLTDTKTLKTFVLEKKRSYRAARGLSTKMDRFKELREVQDRAKEAYTVELYPGTLHFYLSDEYYQKYPWVRRWLEFVGPHSGIEIIEGATHKQLVNDHVVIERLARRLQAHLWATEPSDRV